MVTSLRVLSAFCGALAAAGGSVHPLVRHGARQAPAISWETDGSAEAAAFGAFLREMATRTWTNPEADNSLPFRFVVSLSSSAPRTVVVMVSRDGSQLARRSIEVADPGATRLTVWVLVRDTINRALVTGHRTTVAPTHSGDQSPPPKSQRAKPAPLRAPIRRSRDESAAKGSRVAWTLMLALAVPATEQTAAGACVGANAPLGAGYSVGGEVGYQVEASRWHKGLARGLVIHHVPVRLRTSRQILSRATASLEGGVAVVGVLRYAASDGQRGLGVGAGVGPFVELSRDGDAAVQPCARVGASMRLVRQRYVLPTRSATEPLWQVSLAAGLVWR